MSSQNMPNFETDPQLLARQKKSRLKFLGIVLVCLSPVLLSYFAYYVWKPEDRKNYGDLIEPQRPAGGLAMTQLDGKPLSVDAFRKRFVVVSVEEASCNEACVKRQFFLRQVHAMTGRDRERVERVWIIPTQPGATPDKPSAKRIAANEGVYIAYANRDVLAKLLPPAAGHALNDHLFVIDVQGNLMMRWPVNPDPYKVKKDLMVLLKAAGVR